MSDVTDITDPDLMGDLTQFKCEACEGGTPPMPLDQARGMMDQVPGWELVEEENKLIRRYKFKNFRQAMAFVNQVAGIAEEEGHHPDIYISYSRVTLDLTTHAIKGLSRNDFIMAAKINRL